MSTSKPQELHWQALSTGPVATYLLATRPKFYMASVLPVLLGTAWGYSQTGTLDLMSFLLALAAIICVHACINVLNDVYDDINGTDRINQERIFPFSGGSRFIQEGVLSRRQMYRWGVCLGLAAMLLGLLLILREGLPVLWFGLTGLSLGILYSAPPVALAGRGLGELAVVLGVGILPVVGAAWLQTGQWDPVTVVLALPVGIWAGCILLINEIPDRTADQSAGKHTLVVRFGVRASTGLYISVNILALGVIAALAAGQSIPPASVFLPAVLVLSMLVILYRSRDFHTSRSAMTRIIQHTLLTHMLGSLWLSLWVLF